jgi:small subunit ribosomal protein S9
MQKAKTQSVPVTNQSKGQKYFEAVGKRKTATARVRIFPDADFSILINNKKLDSYFSTKELRHIVETPLKQIAKEAKRFKITVKIRGGGIHSQAEAVRHGISRALVKLDAGLRSSLKSQNFLRRDSRMKERRKFGLKKARRAPQWSKR